MSFGKRVFLENCIFIIFLLSGSPQSLAEVELSEARAVELLHTADLARGAVAGGMVWQAQLSSTEDGETFQQEFSVKCKGVDALVEAISPPRSKGELYLFNDRTMWFYKPSLRKPVAISARQKLAGQAAIGDIATTNYARDYNPSLEKVETIDGKKVFVLKLKAKLNTLTYDQIRYWIGEEEKRALKAEFLTLQGKAFKRAEFLYLNEIPIEGQKKPFISRMEITDAQFPENKSIIIYTHPKLVNHSAAVFDVNALRR